jgi:hypothetical protein
MTSESGSKLVVRFDYAAEQASEGASIADAGDGREVLSPDRTSAASANPGARWVA